MKKWFLNWLGRRIYALWLRGGGDRIVNFQTGLRYGTATVRLPQDQNEWRRVARQIDIALTDRARQKIGRSYD